MSSAVAAGRLVILAQSVDSPLPLPLDAIDNDPAWRALADEIAELAAMARPEIGVVTAVQPVHLSRIGTIEAVPLHARGLPETTYALLARAATLWPDRVAVSVLPDAERWQQPAHRTFAQLLADYGRHRLAVVRTTATRAGRPRTPAAFHPLHRGVRRFLLEPVTRAP